MQSASDRSATVGLVTIATGRYIEFVPNLIASAHRHLVGLGPVFVITDAEAIDAEGDVRLLSWERMQWPLPTLLRYRAFTTYAEQLSTVDVLLYSDADMLFVGEVDVRTATGLIAVRHPGYVTTAIADLPFERRVESSACVRQGDGVTYFCGGIQGGKSAAYLAAAVEIDGRIAADEARGITAVWHDESHWNRYLIDYPAEKSLGAEYCTPDVDRDVHSRILAITKDHAAFRNLHGLKRLRAFVAKVRHATARRLRHMGLR